MKKYLVSSIVIIAFIAYSIYQRAFDSQTIPAINPKNTGNTPSVTAPPPTSTITPTSALVPDPSTPPPQQPTNSPTDTPTPTPKPNSPYKDGAYTGDQTDAFYGFIQVKATISSGRLTDVQFLQYPHDHHQSIQINSQADPLLAQEAIQIQSANVDIISGATDSSIAFVKSLQSALNQAKN